MRLLLPLLVLVALMAMLMLRGYVHSEILADHRVRPAAATDQVPEGDPGRRPRHRHPRRPHRRA